MISFVFFGMVGITFLSLYLVDKFIPDDRINNSISNWILLISSYLFVLYADYRFAAVLAITTFVAWFFATKKYYGVGIVLLVLSLAVFKYTNFFCESFALILGNDFVAISLILPLGISFYTFSAISYIVDVSRRKTKPKSLKTVALYLSFFPKFTSGPIQKSQDFFEQIEKKRDIGWNTFSLGIQIFVFGLFKKIVLADRLSVFVNQVYETPMVFGSLTVLLATIAYSMQIYFDFSGYSDMAIGIANILGVKLPRNFNLPYLSRNVTEFWKRWHITLSAWLQEYVYFSLGGNRKGKHRTYINLMAVMIIGGIWHGANWTYIFWGLLHGMSLIFHKLWMDVTQSDKKRNSSIGKIVSTFLTFLFITLCWIFFRATSIPHALTIIQRLFSFEPGLEQPYLWLGISSFILIVSSILANKKSKNSLPANQKMNISKVDAYYPLVDLSSFWGMVAFFVFCGLILSLAHTGGSPFIYGKF